jgi:2-oxoglutarate dehydrogenase E2 component (dihydrolipoamide succinyltransferase)
MPTNVEVPPLGESVTEAVLIRWLKNDGDQVARGDALAELETDKANADLNATASGVFRPAKAPGDTVKVGEVIARIEDGSAAAAAGSKAVQPTAAPRTAGKAEDFAPSVRVMSEENKLDASDVAGTGRGGRVTKEDMVKHLAAMASPGGNGATTVAPPPPEPRPAAEVKKQPEARPAPSAPPAPSSPKEPEPGFDDQGIKRVPMSKIRKRIAQNLILAQQTAAILTTFNEIDLSAITALRTKYKERFQEVYGVGLGFMSFFARATVLALRAFPRVNAMLDGDDVVYHSYVHLGIAVSTERGLMVPILRNAEAMSFARIEAEIKRLASAARDGKVAIQELSGGTFTITNGGVFGSLLSTPILSPPQSGILGMHAIQKRPVAVGDKVEIHPMMYVALSYDHRLVDGRDSVSFLVRIKEYLEDPARLMLEI